MKEFILPVLIVMFLVGLASWSIGKDVDDDACLQTIQTSCTKCHTTERICNNLAESDTNWPEIVLRMGKKGKLSKKVHDTVLACLTEAADPKKFVCDK